MSTVIKPANGIVEIQKGDKFSSPAGGSTVTVNYYSLFGASGTDITKLQQTTNGPASGISYSGNLIAGLQFYVKTSIGTQTGLWCYGFWIWVQNGTNPNPTAPCQCALWQFANLGTGGGPTSAFIASVLSQTLVPGWNLILLPTPVELTPNANYIAEVAVNGNFNDTFNQFGTGDPLNGITKGPLVPITGANKGWGVNTYPNQQNGLFSTLGNDPRIQVCSQADSSGDNFSNFWVDVLIGQVLQPPGYSGTYRIWPNWPMPSGGVGVQPDAADPYNIATEFTLSRAVKVQKLWFYSVAGCTGLPTQCAIWTVGGGTTPGTIVAGSLNITPAWKLPSGAAGSAGAGWLYCDYSASGGFNLPIGTYKVSVYDGAATPTVSTTKLLQYWAPGNPGNGGWINGPITVPDTTHANLAWEYNGSLPGATPPFSNGIQEAGQSTFAQNATNGGPMAYPFLYVDGLFQNYLVDIEVL